MTRPKPWYRHVEDRLKVDLDRVSYKVCIFRKRRQPVLGFAPTRWFDCLGGECVPHTLPPEVSTGHTPDVH